MKALKTPPSVHASSGPWSMWLIILIICAQGLVGCASVNMMKEKTTLPTNEIWHEEAIGPTKAVVVLLHGLNLKPQRMDDWAHTLAEHGAHVIRFALFGHSGDKGHMADVTADLWRAQFADAIGKAQNLSQQKGVPLYFLGFSLGGLVGLEWLVHKPADALGFDKMALIAPALSTPWYSRAAINSLSVFGRGFMLPSRSPEGYRANRGTSVAAYQALFELKDSLFIKGLHDANIDTLVIMDKNDELIDHKNIRKLIWEKKLSRWQLTTVDNRYAYDNYGFRHLMVDKEAMGSELWDSLCAMILKHFQLS